MPSKNPRIHPYISEASFVRLRALAERPGRNESEIVDKAIAAFFSRDFEDERDGALIRRLDRMTRQMEGLKRQQTVTGEAFALFVRYFLTVIPPVPDTEKAAAQAQGHARFETYLESLKTVLADGSRALMNAAEDVMADETAFFTAEELRRLHEPAPHRASQSEKQSEAAHV